MPNIKKGPVISQRRTTAWPVLQLGRQIWIIFLVITSLTDVSSQIDDDFSVEILNPSWQGDRDQFIVNDLGQLQLMAQQEAPAVLFRDIRVDSTYQWEMDIRLDFAPSGSNRLDIALIADSTYLLAANGLFISIGENGSNDAIELYQIIDGDRQVLIRGAEGEIASGVELSLQVILEEGFLQLSYGPRVGVYDVMLDAIPYDLSIERAFLGWICRYTSTRADKFFFDNIYAGPIKIDSIAPMVQDVRLSTSSLSIVLSEPVDPNTVELGNTIFISPSVINAATEVAANQIVINGDYVEDQEYTIDLINVTDRASNGLDTTLIAMIASPIAAGELIINEVLFDPFDGGADYVEVYNKGVRTLQLAGLLLSNNKNGDKAIYNGSSTIAPMSYAVFTTDPDDVISRYLDHNTSNIYQSTLPRLSNSDGNITISYNGVMIDAYDYDERHHLDVIDDVEGISLERKSFNGDSQDPTNWTSAAATVGYGTPGIENSSRLSSEIESIKFGKRQNVISSTGMGNEDELILDYSLNKSGYIGTIEIFDESGSGRGFIIQNENLATEGELIWDGRCDGGDNCQVGIYILTIRLFHSDGSQYQQNITVGVTQ